MTERTAILLAAVLLDLVLEIPRDGRIPYGGWAR